jgi:hypothetical protein
MQISESHQQHDRIVRQLLAHNYSKKVQRINENIPKYSFKFMSTIMLSTRINVDTYLSGKTLLTLQFLHFH